MRKKDAALLITLSIVMTGTFLVISNLESKSKGQSKAWEELPATWEESPPQDLGTPESPGYAWDAAASSNLTNIMDISELANYLVYYFSVPEDAEKYSEDCKGAAWQRLWGCRSILGAYARGNLSGMGGYN